MDLLPKEPCFWPRVAGWVAISKGTTGTVRSHAEVPGSSPWKCQVRLGEVDSGEASACEPLAARPRV